MASYTLIKPNGAREKVHYKVHSGPVSSRLVLIRRIKWLHGLEQRQPGRHIKAIKAANCALRDFDSRHHHRTRQPKRNGGVRRSVHTKHAGIRNPAGGLTPAEKTNKAAASMGCNIPCESGSKSHTPSTFAAPPQFPYTADAGGSGAVLLKPGI